jgi:hypothetical protein
MTVPPTLDVMPVGYIFEWPDDRVPPDCLIPDGSPFRATEYPELAEVLGNAFGGTKDNPRLPNLRVRVLPDGEMVPTRYVIKAA